MKAVGLFEHTRFIETMADNHLLMPRRKFLAQCVVCYGCTATKSRDCHDNDNRKGCEPAI